MIFWHFRGACGSGNHLSTAHIRSPFLRQEFPFKWAFNEEAHEISSASCVNLMHSRSEKTNTTKGDIPSHTRTHTLTHTYALTYTLKRFISFSRQIVKFLQILCSCLVSFRRVSALSFTSCFVLAGLLFILLSLWMCVCLCGLVCPFLCLSRNGFSFMAKLANVDLGNASSYLWNIGLWPSYTEKKNSLAHKVSLCCSRIFN